jgi:hypothetical protein
MLAQDLFSPRGRLQRVGGSVFEDWKSKPRFPVREEWVLISLIPCSDISPLTSNYKEQNHSGIYTY